MKTIEELGLKKREFYPGFDKETCFCKDKNGNRMPYWKEDIISIVDPLKPATFLPLLKLFDVPYIEEEWMRMICAISENTFNENGRRFFFRYLAKMKLPTYKSLGFKDSIILYGDIEDLLDIEYCIQSTIFHKPLEKDN